jgi:hypothetical protein
MTLGRNAIGSPAHPTLLVQVEVLAPRQSNFSGRASWGSRFPQESGNPTTPREVAELEYLRVSRDIISARRAWARHLLHSPQFKLTDCMPTFTSADQGRYRRQYKDALACEDCRRRKRKCDGARPICGTCAKRKSTVPCTYTSRRGTDESNPRYTHKTWTEMLGDAPC